MGFKDSELVFKYNKRKYLEKYIIDNQNYLYRIAISYVKNKDDAFEIVQNTIYKSLSSIELLNEVKSIKAWVTRILVHTCFDFLRANSKFVSKEEVFDSVEDNNYNILNKIVLKNALDKLPSHLKTIVILRFFEDFKIKDISHILDMNENTVKTNLYKALKILKISLGEDCCDV